MLNLPGLLHVFLCLSCMYRLWSGLLSIDPICLTLADCTRVLQLDTSEQYSVASVSGFSFQKLNIRNSRSPSCPMTRTLVQREITSFSSVVSNRLQAGHLECKITPPLILNPNFIVNQ